MKAAAITTRAGSLALLPSVVDTEWASPVFVDSCLGSLLINNTAY